MACLHFYRFLVLVHIGAVHTFDQSIASRSIPVRGDIAKERSNQTRGREVVYINWLDQELPKAPIVLRSAKIGFESLSYEG